MNYIHIGNIADFAYTNEHLLGNPPVGIVPYLHGLGRGQRLKEDLEGGIYLAKRDILLVYPYSCTWGWANEETMGYIDECVDVFLAKYGDTLPMCIAGGSMGGFSALVYACTTKRKLVACAADCPVCDLPRQFEEKPETRQTIYTAYYGEKDFLSAIKERSPVANIAKFPHIPYYINHGYGDTAVPKTQHSDLFVSLMRSAGYDVTYAQPDTAHCKYTEESFANYYGFMAEAIRSAAGGR